MYVYIMFGCIFSERPFLNILKNDLIYGKLLKAAQIMIYQIHTSTHLRKDSGENISMVDSKNTDLSPSEDQELLSLVLSKL